MSRKILAILAFLATSKSTQTSHSRALSLGINDSTLTLNNASGDTFNKDSDQAINFVGLYELPGHGYLKAQYSDLGQYQLEELSLRVAALVVSWVNDFKLTDSVCLYAGIGYGALS